MPPQGVESTEGQGSTFWFELPLVPATEAENGVAAIEFTAERVMDVQMPEMDGLDAARAIRSLPSPQSKTPIIALSANAFASDIDKCPDAGMSTHVGKPFRTEALIVAFGGRAARPE